MVVTFSDQVEVFFIDNEDRKSHWQQIARDRMRFQRRIQAMNDKLGVVFEKSHKLQFQRRIQAMNVKLGVVFEKKSHKLQFHKRVHDTIGLCIWAKRHRVYIAIVYR